MNIEYLLNKFKDKKPKELQEGIKNGSIKPAEIKTYACFTRKHEPLDELIKRTINKFNTKKSFYWSVCSERLGHYCLIKTPLENNLKKIAGFCINLTKTFFDLDLPKNEIADKLGTTTTTITIYEKNMLEKMFKKHYPFWSTKFLLKDECKNLLTSNNIPFSETQIIKKRKNYFKIKKSIVYEHSIPLIKELEDRTFEDKIFKQKYRVIRNDNYYIIKRRYYREHQIKTKTLLNLIKRKDHNLIYKDGISDYSKAVIEEAEDKSIKEHNDYYIIKKEDYDNLKWRLPDYDREFIEKSPEIQEKIKEDSISVFEKRLLVKPIDLPMEMIKRLIKNKKLFLTNYQNWMKSFVKSEQYKSLMNELMNGELIKRTPCN